MGPNVLRGSLRLPYWEETEDRPGPKQGDRLGNSCRNQVRDGGGLGQGRINRRVGSCSTGDVFWKWSWHDRLEMEWDRENPAQDKCLSRSGLLHLKWNCH